MGPARRVRRRRRGGPSAGSSRAALRVLRASLGITFGWFGGMKLAGEQTMSASLVAAITPFDPVLSARLLGAIELALGLGLLAGRRLPELGGLVACHLCGTLLVLPLAPEVAFVDENLLRLSVEGEYVVKNLVLLAAAASLALLALGAAPPGRGPKGDPPDPGAAPAAHPEVPPCAHRP